jgi:hypothetical protein
MKFTISELEDLTWFPVSIRKGMMIYLRFVFNLTGIYQPAIKIMQELVLKTASTQILDLCSGAGGPYEYFSSYFKSKNISIVLSDKFPDITSFEYLKKKSGGNISYMASPIEAADAPVMLGGIRTIFSSFHHFDEAYAEAVLKNVVNNNKAIAVFDGGSINCLLAVLMIFVHPILLFLCTPLFKPLTLSQLFFTYVVPLIPLCTILDGTISLLRLYKTSKLKEITSKLNADNYEWRCGQLKSKWGLTISYLTGYPVVPSKNCYKLNYLLPGVSQPTVFTEKV